MVAPRDRADPNRFPACVVDMPSAFPPLVASPVVYHRNDVKPLITQPRGTDRDRPDGWQNRPSRRAAAHHCEDRWRAVIFEELTKAILESGHLTALDGHYELTGAFATLAIPATLQDSLMARLDRLSTVKPWPNSAPSLDGRLPTRSCRPSLLWTKPSYNTACSNSITPT